MESLERPAYVGRIDVEAEIVIKPLPERDEEAGVHVTGRFSARYRWTHRRALGCQGGRDIVLPDEAGFALR